MRRISPDFLNLVEFRAWEKNAAQARKELLDAVAKGDRPKFKDQIWQQFKRQFLAPDGEGKCMYCESDHGSGFPGHLEHYRPKSEVTEGRKIIQHEGYYWLAYEWQNFLLACASCNTWHSNPSDSKGKHPGKLNEFRVEGGRVSQPCPDCGNWWEEVKKEKPLLLHPFFDEPEEHFQAHAHGVIEGITDRGRETISVCDLNRPLLVQARERAEPQITQKVMEALFLFKQGARLDKAIFGPKEPYSMYLNGRVVEFLKQLTPANSPVM